MGIGEMRRAVFLDRDGVLNSAVVRDGKPYPPASVADLHINPEAPEALTLLSGLGFRLVVITNQPDVGRGTQTEAAVEAMNDHLREHLVVDAFLVCYHDDSAKCECRKPRPGLFYKAAALYDLDLAACYMIGDRWRDVDAGRNAGVTTILIDYRYNERRPDSPPHAHVSSLMEAARWVEMSECLKRQQ